MTRVQGKSPKWKPKQHPPDAVHLHAGRWYCAHCHKIFDKYPGLG